MPCKRCSCRKQHYVSSCSIDGGEQTTRHRWPGQVPVWLWKLSCQRACLKQCRSTCGCVSDGLWICQGAGVSSISAYVHKVRLP